MVNCWWWICHDCVQEYKDRYTLHASEGKKGASGVVKFGNHKISGYVCCMYPSKCDLTVIRQSYLSYACRPCSLFKVYKDSHSSMNYDIHVFVSTSETLTFFIRQRMCLSAGERERLLLLWYVWMWFSSGYSWLSSSSLTKKNASKSSTFAPWPSHNSWYRCVSNNWPLLTGFRKGYAILTNSYDWMDHKKSHNIYA